MMSSILLSADAAAEAQSVIQYNTIVIHVITVCNTIQYSSPAEVRKIANAQCDTYIQCISAVSY